MWPDEQAQDFLGMATASVPESIQERMSPAVLRYASVSNDLEWLAKTILEIRTESEANPRDLALKRTLSLVRRRLALILYRAKADRIKAPR